MYVFNRDILIHILNWPTFFLGKEDVIENEYKGNHYYLIKSQMDLPTKCVFGKV